jgi:hypothetical protein
MVEKKSEANYSVLIYVDLVIELIPARKTGKRISKIR